MPVDYTPLLRILASEARSLSDLERLALQNGFMAFEAVIELPRRIDGLGLRVHGVAIYAGSRLVGFAVRADGVDSSALSELSKVLRVPVIAVEEAGAS